jgi:hypothetical protein
VRFDLIAERAQGRELVEGFAEIEVVRIVDREFGPEAPPFFEVLLEMRVLGSTPSVMIRGCPIRC